MLLNKVKLANEWYLKYSYATLSFFLFIWFSSFYKMLDLSKLQFFQLRLRLKTYPTTCSVSWVFCESSVVKHYRCKTPAHPYRCGLRYQFVCLSLRLVVSAVWLRQLWSGFSWVRRAECVSCCQIRRARTQCCLWRAEALQGRPYRWSRQQWFYASNHHRI